MNERQINTEAKNAVFNAWWRAMQDSDTFPVLLLAAGPGGKELHIFELPFDTYPGSAIDLIREALRLLENPATTTDVSDLEVDL
jgi:hypothetical protein